MRTLLGMILGALLTVGVAFAVDSWNTRPATATTTGSAHAGLAARPMVNWDVVGQNLRIAADRMHATWTRLSHKIAG